MQHLFRGVGDRWQGGCAAGPCAGPPAAHKLFSADRQRGRNPACASGHRCKDQSLRHLRQALLTQPPPQALPWGANSISVHKWRQADCQPPGNRQPDCLRISMAQSSAFAPRKHVPLQGKSRHCARPEWGSRLRERRGLVRTTVHLLRRSWGAILFPATEKIREAAGWPTSRPGSAR
jgi:hypothetical protein